MNEIYDVKAKQAHWVCHHMRCVGNRGTWVLKAMLMRYKNKPRRGVTALLAMIFLVLFATLAVGFYASTTQTTVIATNEKNGVISLTAAESGMDFIRYQLALIKVPPTIPVDQTFDYVASHLQDALESSANLGGKRVAVTSSSVTIPS